MSDEMNETEREEGKMDQNDQCMELDSTMSINVMLVYLKDDFFVLWT